jgi:hypothetical protein
MTHITRISFVGELSPNKNNRKLKIKLSSGSIITAEACHESWEQWGGTTKELYITMPIVEAHNKWLHGGERPSCKRSWE